MNMRQVQSGMDGMNEETALLDRVEDAVLRVNPDLFLAALLLVVAISWLGRLA